MKTLLTILLGAVLAGPAAASEPAADVLLEWNAAILEMADREDGFMTLKGLRTVTMLHLAAHDSLSSIYGRYSIYAEGSHAPDADPVAAVNQAAYTVAISQYPDQKEALDALSRRWAGTVPDNDRSRQGTALGKSIATTVLRNREGDGWDGEAEYRWHPMAPGVYAEFNEHSGTPQGFIFGAGWAKARGFALASPGEFRSAPPPAIDSNDYTAAFNEVKELGRFQSMTRTPDQAHLALWWKDFVENSHNRLARDLVKKEGLSLTEAARLFALLNMSVFDAYISSFDNKFFYNHWRPYTAIRWAANDDNPDTVPEENWTNLHRHTYAFPSYPSAHGTACAAAMTAFTEVFGDDYAVTIRIPEVDIAGPFSGKIQMQPPTRSFDSFADAAMECSMSRVYLGIHFRYDSTAGNALGKQVGQNVVESLLRPR